MGFLVGRGWSLCGEVSHGEGFPVCSGLSRFVPAYSGLARVSGLGMVSSVRARFGKGIAVPTRRGEVWCGEVGIGKVWVSWF